VSRLELQRELRALEQSLEPPENLGVSERQLLEGAVADLGGEIGELVVELGWERFLQFLGDLAVDASEMLDGARFGPDPPGFLQDLPGHASDPQELLRIDPLDLGLLPRDFA
jgi:hypothetical protein